MSPQDLTNAIISGINAGGEQFLEGTLAAALPIVWLAILGLHFFPDVVTADALPLTGGLAAVAVFGVLLIKLMGDPDHDLRAYRLTSILLAIGAVLYFVPYLLGVQANSVAQGGLLTISNFLVTNTNPNWAVGLAYVSIVLLAIMGAVATGYALRTGGRPEVPESTSNVE